MLEAYIEPYDRSYILQGGEISFIDGDGLREDGTFIARITPRIKSGLNYKEDQDAVRDSQRDQIKQGGVSP